MGHILHGSAKTTHAIRATIQRSCASNAALMVKGMTRCFLYLMCGPARPMPMLGADEGEARGNPSGLAATMYRAAQRSRTYVSNRDHQTRPNQTVAIRRGP